VSYGLRFSPERVGKALDRIEPLADRVRVAAAVAKLADDPFRRDLDIKKLTGREDFRLRVGSWRVTYLLDTTRRAVVVTAVVNRRDAYR